MKKLVIWDWDNTLADTRSAVRAGLQDVVRHYELPDITDKDVLNVMTCHRGAFWQNNFGEKVSEAIAYYVKSYSQHGDLVCLFPETIDILQYIQNKNIPQIVLSNKNENALIEEVKCQGVRDFFAAVQGTNGPLGKPDIEFVKPLLNRFQPDEVFLIGDGISDMLMAQNMGATSIMVHQPNKEWPHHYDCDTLSEVARILEQLL